MDIAVYSGSFNPLHIGHLAILVRLSEMFDKTLLVVSPVNPLKESATVLDAEKRLHEAKEAVARHPELNGKVEVSDIEFHLPTPNYTINTLDALKASSACDNYTLDDLKASSLDESFTRGASEPSSACDSYTLVTGGDQIADFIRWRDYRRILTDYGVAVFPREGFDIQEIRHNLLAEDKRYRIKLIDMPLVKVSSTDIRKALARGEDISKLLM